MGWREFVARMTGMAVLVAAAPGCAQPQKQAMNAVPIEYLAHLATIPVYVNGTGPHRFVVDTGAGINVLNEKLVAKLGIPALGKSEVGSPMGTEPLVVDSLSIAEMRVGDFVVQGAPAVALNLDELFVGLEAPDGVLAAASFEGQLFTIDFPNGHVLVRPGALPPADGQSIFDFEEDVPRVRVGVAGHDLPVALDTGAPLAVSVPSSFEDTLPFQAAPAVTGHRRTVDSSQEVRSAQLDGDLTIGKYTIADPTIALSGQAPFGHLGMEILGQFALTIDRSNHRIAFEQGDAPKPTVLGGLQRKIVRRSGSKSYGIRLAGVGGDTLNVLGVDADAPAAAGGLLAGDRILALNGQPLKALSDSERVTALRGSPLLLRIERAGKEMELTLSLE